MLFAEFLIIGSMPSALTLSILKEKHYLRKVDKAVQSFSLSDKFTHVKVEKLVGSGTKEITNFTTNHLTFHPSSSLQSSYRTQELPRVEALKYLRDIYKKDLSPQVTSSIILISELNVEKAYIDKNNNASNDKDHLLNTIIPPPQIGLILFGGLCCTILGFSLLQ